jgi:hypothetical protein
MVRSPCAVVDNARSTITTFRSLRVFERYLGTLR